MKKTDEEIRHENAMEEIEEEKKAKLEVEGIRHNNHMTELKAERDYKLEVERIRTSEIRKSQERKANIEFMKGYK